MNNEVKDFVNEVLSIDGVIGQDIAQKMLEVIVYLETQRIVLQEQVWALAAENVSLLNSSVCTLQEGRPRHGFYASEWFIAKLKNGQYAALKALPEHYSHDYRTNDHTYYTKDWVVGWMQTPDTEYRPDVETPDTDAVLREIRAQAVESYANYSDECYGTHDKSGEDARVYAARIRSGEQP